MYSGIDWIGIDMVKKGNRRASHKTIFPNAIGFLLVAFLVVSTWACSGGSGGSGEAPAIDALRVESVEADALTLARPDITKGDPVPTVQAYIGRQDTMSVNGKEVLHAWQGPVDVSSSSYRFADLTPETAYKVVVVAENYKGYAVQEIVQATPNHPFALNDLVIDETTPDSILLKQPSFSIAGNPQPTVDAYIGVKGNIGISGKVVNGFLEGPVDVTSQEYRFIGLSPSTDYTIYVVADNGTYYAIKQISQNTGAQAPILNGLTIASTDSTSIAIQQPTFATAGNPLPTVEAYIGINGSITVSGDTVMDYLQGPVDVASSGCQFTDLSPNGNYTVVVIAKNSAGFSSQTINQSTMGIAPVLNSLELDGTTQTSITLVKPEFSTAGNPTPSVQAYIGVKDSIEVNGKNVSGFSVGPVDVVSGGYMFTELNPNTEYKIVVVAENNGGYSVREIGQKTSGIASELDDIHVKNVSDSTITLEQPTFKVTGNPMPVVHAYIGKNGTIAVSGTDVTGYDQKVEDVSQGDHQFTGLLTNTDYRIIAVADNGIGSSVKEVEQSTNGVPPDLNPLVIQNTSSTTITIARPSFAVAGNPLPEVKAYLGLDSDTSFKVDDNGVVIGYKQVSTDILNGAYQFKELNEGVKYRIIVMAKNDWGYDWKEITQESLFDPKNLHTVLINVNASGGIEAVHVDGSRLYVAKGREGLAVYDIKIDGSLDFVKKIPLDGEAREVTTDGDYAYVTGSRCALWIVDVAGNLVKEHPLLDEPRGSVLYGNYLLIAAGNSGIQVVDVSNPSDPKTETNIVTSGYVTAVDVVDSTAYATSIKDDIGYLDVINVSDVSNPQTLESFLGFTEPLDVRSRDGFAYVADGIGELWVVDVQNKLKKQIDVPDPARVVKLTIDGVYLYCADAKGVDARGDVHVYDISTPETPILQSTVSAVQMKAPKYVAVAGDYAFVADGFNGIHVLDVYDKAACEYMRTSGVPGFTRNVSVNSTGEWMYVSEANVGLRIVKRAGGMVEGTLDLVNPNGLDDRGNFVFVADGNNGLAVINVANKSNPSVFHVSSGDYTRDAKIVSGHENVLVSGDKALTAFELLYDEDGNFTGVAKGTSVAFDDAHNIIVIPPYAYVAGGNQGLHIVELSFNESGVISSMSCKLTYDTSGYAHDVVLVGNTAFIADGGGGVEVVRITYEPMGAAHIVSVSSAELGMNAKSIVADGKYVYVGGDAPGIVVLDAENLMTVPYTFLDTPEAVQGLTLFGHTLFVADGFEGLQVFGE